MMAKGQDWQGRTEAESRRQNLTTHPAEDDSAHIVDAIDSLMPQLECADTVVGPGVQRCNDAEANNPWYHPEGIEGMRDGQNAQSDLCLHH